MSGDGFGDAAGGNCEEISRAANIDAIIADAERRAPAALTSNLRRPPRSVRRLQEPGDRVVLGPAADGAYYLIGLRRFHQRQFEAIDWSTERVYRQTIARCGNRSAGGRTRRVVRRR
jgi:Uncharacterized protein conserved in bacteria (DUF2064)